MELKNLSLLGYALITGGGTVAPVDAVRVWANDAEGDTSVAVAEEFVRRGIKVVLILSKLAWYKHRHDLSKEITVLVYYTYADYVARIHQAVAEHGQPAYAIATAAVSDYGYLERPAHKTRSDGGPLTITIPPLPKVIDSWRDLFGAACRIVGFKLLTRHDDTEESLVATARRQNDRAYLTATIANFLEDTEQEVHPIWFVLANGRSFRIAGTGQERAEAIVGFTLSEKTKFSSTIIARARPTRRVPLIHRGTDPRDPHPDKWAPPGGGEEESDAAEAARLGISTEFYTALREGREEAHLDLGTVEEPPESHVFRWFSSRKVNGVWRFWFNTAFLVDVDSEVSVTSDGEEAVDVVWKAEEDAVDLRMGPLTAATLGRLPWRGFVPTNVVN